MTDGTPVPTGKIAAEGIFGMTLAIWTHKADDRGFTGVVGVLDDTGVTSEAGDLLAVAVTLAELSKISDGLLGLLLGANGVGELSSGDIDAAKVSLSDGSALTMEALYMLEREYGEPAAHADGHIYSRVEEHEVAEIITLTLNRAADSRTIQLDIDAANRLYVNLAGLMFQHARALS
jgi:hypothetical protein